MARTSTALLLLAGALMNSCAEAEIWSLPHTGTATGSLALSLESFSSATHARSKGAISVTPAELQDPDGIEAGLRDGKTHLGAIALSRLAREDALIGMDEVPFLATSFQDASKLWQVVRPAVERRLAGRGLVLLYAVPGEPRSMLSRRSVTGMQALRGARVVVDVPALEDFVRLSGAKSAGKGPRSAVMQAGKADLAFVSSSEAMADEAWTYGRYFIRVPAWFPKQLVVVSRAALVGLERAARDALLSAADAARSEAWQMAKRNTEERIQNLRDRGVKVRTPEARFLVALEDLGRDLLFRWSEAAGEAGAAQVEAYYDIK